MTGVRAGELAVLSLFSGCREGDLAPLAGRLQTREVAPGEVLMREGEPAEEFMLLAAGLAAVTRDRAGTQAVVAELGPGMIVGELALLRRAPRVATVRAREPVVAYVGDAQAFASLLDIPGVAERLARTARQRIAGLLRPVPIRLRDGTQLLVRPVLPGDKERAAESLEGFSAETMYRRFMTGGTLSEAAIAYFVEVDYVGHFVWVVVASEDGPAIADARFVRSTDDPVVAEVAFTVGDAYQGRGLGGFLMGALAVAARETGVERFEARVLVDNQPMRRLLDGAGAQWTLEEPGVVLTTVAVPSPERYLHDPDVVVALASAVRLVLDAAG